MSKSPVAVVTGASSGIGAAIARAFALRGMTVVAAARRKDRLQSLAKEVESESDGAGKIVPAEVDLRDFASIDKLFAVVDACTQSEGPLTILVNNAGLGHSTPLMSGEREKFKEMLDVNVLALCVCTREAVQRMEAAKTKGHIFHISSMSAHRVPEGSGVYSATKFAVRSLTEGLRKELRDAGSPIRVSAVSPGFVETEFAAHFHQSEDKAKETYGQFDVLQSEDIANMVQWLFDQPPHVEVHDVLVRPTAQKS